MFEISKYFRNVPPIRFARQPLHRFVFGIFVIWIWDLSFDLAQDGELAEPFGIWVLLFVIYPCVLGGLIAY